MAKYRKKPVVVEAVQWNGDNYDEIVEFTKADIFQVDNTNIIIIKTLGGLIKCSLGDYIIKDAPGEFYLCNYDIFERTYEEVDEDKTQKETYLTKYLKENNCSYEEFVKDQEMYDGFCPIGLGESPCSTMDCVECWNQEIKGE